MRHSISVLFCILAFALLIRLFLLDRFPVGITHDELNYVVAAKSLFLTGSFPPGTAPAILPTSMSNITVTIAEVPAYILAAIIGFLPTSLFAGRVVGAIFSVLGVAGVYFLLALLTKKRSIAIIGSLLMPTNPWSFLMGRTVFEVNFFVAFFLWGFIVLLITRGWKIFYALPLFILGLFSYTGGQIAFFAFMVVSLIYHYLVYEKNAKGLKVHLVFLGFISILLAGYIYIATQNQSVKARGGEIYLPGSKVVAEMVDQKRKLAAPSPINNLVINKATVFTEGFLNKYINSFSPDYLFLKGELRAAFSYQEHGNFYLVDFLFIILGLSALYAMNKKTWVVFLAIILGGSITAGLNVVESSYSQRNGLMYPFLAMLSAIGIYTIISGAKSKKIRIIYSAGIALIYLASFANLVHIYLFRFPVYASDGWFFQDRVLGRYIQLTKTTYPESDVIVYTSEPKIIFQEYLFFSGGYDKSSVDEINLKMDQKIYSYNGVTFTDQCPVTFVQKDEITIFEGSFKCENTSFKDPLRITRLKDVYENYLIYNDKICQDTSMDRFVSQEAYRDFEVEKQDTESFCHNWITEITQ